MIEADVTIEEWLEGCELLIQAGKVSSDKRNEMVLVSDVLGVETLVDTLATLRSIRADDSAARTDSAILGPFYRTGVPIQEMDTSIIRQHEPEGEYTHLYGTVYDKGGEPLKDAVLDVWHDAPDGLYGEYRLFRSIL